MHKIILGPLLGVESDCLYTVCILIDKDLPEPRLIIDNLTSDAEIKSTYTSEYKTTFLNKFTFYRFSFESHEAAYAVEYRIKCYNSLIKAENGYDYWRFTIADKENVPNIAFASCNGRHDVLTCRIPNEDYNGWEALINQKPDYLFLTGDQVYTDQIFKSIPELSEALENQLEGIPQSLSDKIEEFFLNLYITSWQKPFINVALARIPNVMSWDDHDILDGYGSFEQAIQTKLTPLFDIAYKYYSIFQLRSFKNQAIIHSASIPSKLDLNQIFFLRNYLFILPDTRTNRSQEQVLSFDQYTMFDKYRDSFLRTIPKEKYTVLFVLPVPIAHIDFYSPVEKLLGFMDRKKKGNYMNFNADDAIDHWDHKYHKNEQVKMLNLCFSYANELKAKHLIIVSGDVHSAGASTVFNLNGDNTTATQLITSPIVNEPSPWWLRVFAKRIKLVEDYACELKNYGDNWRKLFYSRNFLIISSSKKGLKAILYTETKKQWYHIKKKYRTINKFNKTSARPSYRLLLSKTIRDLF